jgi:peptidyl-prolyl cis-trans isomerase C
MHSVFPPRRVLAATAVVALSFLAGPITTVSGEEKAGDTVVAKVNGKPITEAQMKMAEAELGSDLGDLPPEVKRHALAEYLIDNALFAEAAEAQKLGATPEFQEQLNYLKQRLLRQEYFEKKLKSTISEDEAKLIYDERVSQIPAEDEVSARHILVDSEKKAKELRAKIVAGADFAQLAKENSSDRGTKDRGGSLGYFTKGQMVPAFDTAVFKMKKGEISEPVKTSFGWHIIKLDDRRPKEPPSFESVKNTILNSLAVRKVQEKAAELRKAATLDYVDAGIKKQVEEQKAKQAEAAAAAKKNAGKPVNAPKP